MRMKMKKLICSILTLGRHWWAYYPEQRHYVRCQICGKLPESMWNIFCDYMSMSYIKKRKQKFHSHYYGVMILILSVLICGGCQDAVGLRFSPTEVQKQSAELTNQLARKINNEGTEPQSPASKKLVDGTTASLAYTGRPNVAPDPDNFDTITTQAETDAVGRPDVAGTMDSIFQLGIGLATLLGGAGGIKLAQGLRTMHAKAKGFTEVVTQNDFYKQIATPEEWEKFKRAQAAQTPTTRQLVATVKTDNQIQLDSIPVRVNTNI